MTFDPETLRTELETGLLCFPVTHARKDFAFDEEPYREHVAWQSSFPVAGVFAAGGIGEFPALTPAEVKRVVRAAVAASARPVVAPAGYGTAQAVAMARDAESAGAAGVFLLPPYLTSLPTEGLVAHVRAVCAATGLGVVVYHRASGGARVDAVRRLAEECPNLHPLPYPGTGVPTCSSAIVNFAPRFALELHTAVHTRDTAAVYRMLDEFVLPYLGIRDRRAGYAVPVVKAALSVVGRPAGPVRPPLTDLTATEAGELKALLEKVDAV
ncbi:dihydrodipicolinate synthase family protein [Actinophytocola sp.]|uniref:dihydrodipicolinate synthase family protein n=1 Tax=Actinophytocola sp. TaxID=1872138 RepID=UPI003D6AA0FC